MSASTRLAILERPGAPLEAITTRLLDWGFACRTASTTGELLGTLGRHPVDLLILDAHSDEALRAITALTGDARFRDLPLIVATDEEVEFVAGQALALGAADVLVLPLADAELFARIRALSRLAGMGNEQRRRVRILAEFGVLEPQSQPHLPVKERIEVLLIGPAGPEQIQVIGALGNAATIAYAESASQALDRLLVQQHDIAMITGLGDPRELEHLCASIRADAVLFDLPIMLIGHALHFPERALPFEWGVSDVLLHPFHPGVLRLRVHGWIHQQRLRRRLRGVFGMTPQPSVVDGLTHLFNHGFLHSYLDQAIAEAYRTETPLALAGFSVDRIGLINAEHGYAIGDRALFHAGSVIARTCRAEDLPARVGGDRFVIVVKNAGTSEALRVAERISGLATRTPLVVGGQRRLPLSLQAGVAEFHRGDDAPALIARAFERIHPPRMRRAS